MPVVQRLDDNYFYMFDDRPVTSGTGECRKPRGKHPGTWTEDKKFATQMSQEKADELAKYFKRYYGLNCVVV